VRDFAALAIDDALQCRYDIVGIVPPRATPADALDAAVGAQLGAYRFDSLRKPPKDSPWPNIHELKLINAESGSTLLDRAAHLAAGVCLARTLINEPPNVCTPERFADIARDLTNARGVEATILGREEVIAKGMGGLVGVSQGASREPRFIHIKYTPESGQTEGAIALVGKGLTFDSGGLCIKPAKHMADMHIDMGGAAAVLGAMHVVSKLQPNIPVHGIVGACENMTGADAYRPSDVLTMYSGKTVEVLNTDAEGRLVLADALHYATQLDPACIVNLATLTGACLVALGSNYGGLFSDDESLAKKLLDAANAIGENLWRLPLDPKLADDLKSHRADITNLGGPYGGAITAAHFLKNFKGDYPWAHLDIAGPVLAAKNDGYIKTGGTGFGVLTLWSLIENWQR